MMLELKRYEIAEGIDTGDLLSNVEKLRAKGYEPVGGISHRPIDGRMYQAMALRIVPLPPGELAIKEPHPPFKPRNSR